MSKGQNIYHYDVRLTWKKKRGNGYINIYRGTESDPFQFVSRSNGIDELNGNPEIVFQIMNHLGLTGSSIADFKVLEVYEQKLISESFYYKEEEDE